MKTAVSSQWDKAIMICRKCSKKVGGEFGSDRKPLAKALRQHLKLKKGRKAAAGILEVSCLGVCPKNAITLVDGARPREWRLVRPGEDLDALAAELSLMGGE